VLILPVLLKKSFSFYILLLFTGSDIVLTKSIIIVLCIFKFLPILMGEFI